jgi:Protein of unknown function (DUF721).
MSEQFRKASDIVSALFSGLERDSLERSNNLVRGWKETVDPKVAAHSRIVDLDKGSLVIEVDHPGWSQQILLSKKRILDTLSRSFPDLEFRNIVIRVVSECKTPYKKSDEVVGSGIPRVAEEIPDVEVRQDVDDDLKKVLEKLKDSIRKGRSTDQ